MSKHENNDAPLAVLIALLLDKGVITAKELFEYVEKYKEYKK